MFTYDSVTKLTLGLVYNEIRIDSMIFFHMSSFLWDFEPQFHELKFHEPRHQDLKLFKNCF